MTLVDTLRTRLANALVDLACWVEPRDSSYEQAVDRAIRDGAAEVLRADPVVDSIIAKARERAGRPLSEMGHVSTTFHPMTSETARAIRDLADLVESGEVIGCRVVLAWHGAPTCAAIMAVRAEPIGEA